jgi:uncharacterized cupredoxin-like copper-binding protein
MFCTLLLVSGGVAAHGDESHAKKAAVDYSKVEEKAFGKATDPKRAKRTMTVEMSDAMRFTPAEITVKRGDTVRFVIHNKGKTMHEMVLGTEAELKEHAEMMRKFPEMEHDEPYMAHVAPGKRAEIGWQFTQPGVFYYGCLLPGHFEAGMVGRIIVK